MNLRAGPCFVAVLLMSSLGNAAEKSFSWAEIVHQAQAGNESLKSSQRSLQASEFQEKASYGNFFPQLSASLTGSRGTNDAYEVSLTATQNLFSGFLDSGKIAQSKANYETARANLQISQSKVSYDLKSAVAQLLYAQNYVKLTQSIIERRELNLKMVQLRFDSGRENKGSLLLSKAYLEDARLDHLQATQDLAVAQTSLAKVLGDEDLQTYVFNDKIPIQEPPAESAVDFQKMVLQTPAYKAAVAQEDLSKASLTQAEAGFFPSLNLSARTGKAGDSWYPNQDRWSVGATLSVPLLNGGRDYFSTRAAAESLKASAFSRSAILKETVIGLKNNYAAYTQAVQKLKVDQAYLEAAETREKISRQKYNNGLSSFDDWDIIESDLIKRQKSFLQSERDRVVAEAAWEQAQGIGVLQ